jgi:hypothetical protein
LERKTEENAVTMTMTIDATPPHAPAAASVRRLFKL